MENASSITWRLLPVSEFTSEFKVGAILLRLESLDSGGANDRSFAVREFELPM